MNQESDPSGRIPMMVPRKCYVPKWHLLWICKIFMCDMRLTLYPADTEQLYFPKERVSNITYLHSDCNLISNSIWFHLLLDKRSFEVADTTSNNIAAIFS